MVTAHLDYRIIWIKKSKVQAGRCQIKKQPMLRRMLFRLRSKQNQTKIKKEVPAATPVKTETKTPVSETVKQQTKPVEKNTMYTGYKIQILATLSQASFDNIMLQFNLKEQIREDHTDKWFRYSVGEFKNYREASAYRKILYSRNKIKDAFVVKFVNGKRVAQVGNK